MFKLFSRSNSSHPDYSLLGTDMHSHLLPGIDDGAPNLEISIELIKGMMGLGYSKLITTPHIMWDMYQNTRDIILSKLDLLRERVQKEGLDIEIHAAAEYFLDDHVAGLVRNNEPLLTLGDTKMVLVEFSLAHPSMSLKEILFDMLMQGHQPVIAHPERYTYLEHNKDFYEELKDTGCLFALNILSLGNAYGKSVHELAQWLIKKDFYDLAGTDLHHFRHLEGLGQSSLSAPLLKLVNSGRLRNKEL